MQIRIVQRPIGEAPEWVRDAWIGMTLPTSANEAKTLPGVGVVSGPHTFLGQIWARLTGRVQHHSGYLVLAGVAVDELARVNPAAAHWWRGNAPHLLGKRRSFIFDVDCAELLL